MKVLNTAFFTAAAFAGLMAAGSVSAAERHAKIEVSGLTCPSCPYIAAEAVKSVDSVKIVTGDYDEAAQIIVFDVTYDDAVTTPETIAEASMDYGYPGRVLDPTATGS